MLTLTLFYSSFFFSLLETNLAPPAIVIFKYVFLVNLEIALCL